MDGDLVLKWLSFRGHGRLSDVTSSVAALMEGPPHAKTNAARAYLRRLEVLGHLDLLWPESKWQIRPTVLTQIPGSSAFALVIGQRTAELEERLEAEAVLHKVRAPDTGTTTLGDPGTLLLEYDSEAELSEIAANAGAGFIPCAASSLAANLPLLVPGPRAGGPNTYGSAVEMFNVFQREFTHVEAFRRDGLYKQIVNGRWQYWLLRSGLWSSIGYAEGMCLTMSEVDSQYLQFEILEDAEDPIGTLHVNAGLPLPVQHRQALALCSGVSPVKTTGGPWTYHNVPSSVALAVARSIHQHLKVR
ncbi:hypothetical protein [Arthrobacter sp. NicSoilB11]|uniref:hypothetical protein n=1 Tax=Arthrobacter sp. NicSoilB11 TaxID=2830999 RepID=UPI001CC3FFB9|nr:hypothetical protein [Arthrobacter sp. NicSoilB11]BCW74749.1 hypothetical protein NicSoilB11_10740 [Arthrobacter sp. NicSoilB11]